jgi:gas vesicle protein
MILLSILLSDMADVGSEGWFGLIPVVIGAISILLTALATRFATRVFEKKKFREEVNEIKKTIEISEQNILKTKIENYESLVNNMKERLDKMMIEFRAERDEYITRESKYLSDIRDLRGKVINLETELIKNNAQIERNSNQIERLLSAVCFKENCPDRINKLK